MESIAKSNFFNQSAKKVRKELQFIRGKQVDVALNTLQFAPQKATTVIEKTIQSTIANYLQADETNELNADGLFIKEAFVNEGPTQKRFRPASMGRASRIRKRSSHITIILTDENKKRK